MKPGDERLPRHTEVIVQPGNRSGKVTTPVRESGNYHIKIDNGPTVWVAERNVTPADDEPKRKGKR